LPLAGVAVGLTLEVSAAELTAMPPAVSKALLEGIGKVLIAAKRQQAD